MSTLLVKGRLNGHNFYQPTKKKKKSQTNKQQKQHNKKKRVVKLLMRPETSYLYPDLTQEMFTSQPSCDSTFENSALKGHIQEGRYPRVNVVRKQPEKYPSRTKLCQ